MNTPGSPLSAIMRPQGRRAALCSVACLVAALLPGCGGGRKRVEVTTTNFTGPPFLNSTQVQTFGVAVGDSEVDARRAIQRAGLTWEMPFSGNPLVFVRIHDPRGRVILLVHTSPPPGGRTGTWNYLFHRLWKAPRYDFTVDAIEWHAELAPRLAGNNALLLGGAIMLPDSSLRRHLLGGDGVRESHLEMSGRVEFVSYSFTNQGFKISGSRRNGVWAPESI